MNFLQGYRTYIIAAIVFVLGGLQALGFPIPPEVFALLGGAGLATLRASVQ